MHRKTVRAVQIDMRLAFLCVPAIVIAACTGGTVRPKGSCASDTASIQAKIVGPKCATASCHAGATPAAGLDLSGDLEARLVGVASSDCQNKTLVVAADPDASYFVEKLGTSPTCGSTMPFGQAPLSSAEIECVKAWVSGLVASAADDGGVVDAGTMTCATPLVACGTSCVNTRTDGKNCGKCGTVCPVACSNGTCVAACPPNTTLCGSSCVDTKTDDQNCGACGKACANGQICSAGACTCGPTTVSFASQVQPIFNASCATFMCHGNIAKPAQGLDLRAGKAYAALVNVPSTQCSNRTRVVPSNVPNSYLWSKLTGVGMCFGSQMPKTGGLTAAAEDTIRAWICNGAPNN